MPRKTKAKDIINFLAEAGQLKRVKRSGWWVIGIKDPESVADHCFRCAVLGYILARMEKADPYRVLLMSLFNDIHEARINDLHKMGHRYINFKSAERKVHKEQLKLFPAFIRKEFSALRNDYDRQYSQEAIIARDADILECIIQAKEYLDFGFKQAKSFIEVGRKFLRTKSAKLIVNGMDSWDHKEWWLHLKKFKR